MDDEFYFDVYVAEEELKELAQTVEEPGKANK